MFLHYNGISFWTSRSHVIFFSLQMYSVRDNQLHVMSSQCISILFDNINYILGIGNTLVGYFTKCSACIIDTIHYLHTIARWWLHELHCKMAAARTLLHRRQPTDGHMCTIMCTASRTIYCCNALALHGPRSYRTMCKCIEETLHALDCLKRCTHVTHILYVRYMHTCNWLYRINCYCNP